MHSLYATTDLSRGDLRLFLNNDLGYPQDAHSVLWTVFRDDGMVASGIRLPAIKADTGEYYAPWGCSDSPCGCYRIVWEYRQDPSSQLRAAQEKFLKVESAGFACCPSPACSGIAPVASCDVFMRGQVLGPGDLSLYLTNSDGLPTNAFVVFWSIVDVCGRPVTQRALASSGPSVGEYYAPWFVNVSGTDLRIRWEYMEDADSPLEAVEMRFSVVGAPCVLSTGVFISDSSSVPPIVIQVINQCCDVEVARVIHLASQVLPGGGGFTGQAVYQIPDKVRKVAFYVTYTRGATGGYPVLRLFWGNGTEETQSTLVDLDFTSLGSQSMQSMFLNDFKGPVPTSDDPVGFLLEAGVPGGAVTVRLLVAEGGVVGLPGTAEITLTASS